MRRVARGVGGDEERDDGRRGGNEGRRLSGGGDVGESNECDKLTSNRRARGNPCLVCKYCTIIAYIKLA